MLGWLPLSALIVPEDLGYAMATRPVLTSYAGLYDLFSADAVMSSYFVVHIVCQLLAYVLLAPHCSAGRAALGRVGVDCEQPLTLAAFVVPGRPLVFGQGALLLLLIG